MRTQNGEALVEVLCALREVGESDHGFALLTELGDRLVDALFDDALAVCRERSAFDVLLELAAVRGWCPRCVLIPAGRFEMGARAHEQDTADSDEHPSHWVELTRGFLVSKTVVTRSQWQAVLGTMPAYHPPADSLPVERVCWYDVVGYCLRLGELLGLDPAYTLTGIRGTPGLLAPPDWDAQRSTFSAESVTWNEGPSGMGRVRLLTEAEWEYAARCGDTGDELPEARLDTKAWTAENAGGVLHPVATREPNPWGLYDMLGNVWEWVWDPWRNHYVVEGDADTPVRDPTGGEETAFRGLRGGGYYGPPRAARATARNGYPPNACYASVGFRWALTLPDER